MHLPPSDRVVPLSSERRQRLVQGLAAWSAAAVPGLVWALPATAPVRNLPDFADLVEKVGPAVVNIRTTERGAEGARLPFRRGAPSLQQSDEVPRGEGSGFIIGADGHILTNAHVIAGASQVYVTMTDKREFKARVVGADERTDVALLKITGTGLPVLPIGDVGKLRVGEWVVAIGSPFGFDNTVTAGIVSAKKRELGSDVPLLQTDVAVNPGNSGGPLINVRGEAVGINSQIYSPVGSYVGISFAIPIDEAMRIALLLKTTGRVVRGYLGIRPTEVTREAAEEYKLDRSGPRGAFISLVVKGGPAEKAGLKLGDIVLALDGKPVVGAVDLRRTLGLMKPGTQVVLRINRRGKLLDVPATLAELPASDNGAVPAPVQPAPKGSSSAAREWGLSVGAINDSDRQRLRGHGGVKVTAVSGRAQAIGLKAGDIIVSVADVEIIDPRQFEEVMARVDTRRALPVVFLRGEWAQFTRIPPPK